MIKNKIKKVLAFSLIEMLVVLIAMSCIAGFLTPAITKRMKASGVVIGQSEKCKKWPGCSACTASGCTSCTKTCGSGEYTKVEDCSCVACTSKFSNCVQCRANYCTRCSTGYGLKSDGTCEICAAGYYSDGTTICIKSPAGHCASKDGTNCNTGTGSTTYMPCPAGTYQSSAQGTSCPACGAGKINPKIGQKECINCPKGREKKDATTCKTCAAGTYNGTEGGTCQNCPAGQVSTDGASECKQCEAGTVATNRVICQPKTCEAGQYVRLSDTTCQTCSGNSISAGGSATSCTACPAGTVVNSTHTSCDIKTCSKGQYLRTSDTTCQNCDTNQVSPGGTATTCTTCGTGSQPNSDKTACEQISCSPGDYFNTTEKKCKDCGTNQISPGGTVTSCTTCASGTTANSDKTLCTASSCPVDTYLNTNECTACSETTYSYGGTVTSCSACSSKWEHCTKCTSTGCTECESGYIASGGTCEADKFTYTFSCSGHSFDESTKIIKITDISANCTFIPKRTASARILLVGAGGGVTNSSDNYCGGGAGGVQYEGDITLTKDKSYNVTVGAGVAGAAGGKTVFDTLEAAGGGTSTCYNSFKDNGGMNGTSTDNPVTGNTLPTNGYGNGGKMYCKGQAGRTNGIDGNTYSDGGSGCGTASSGGINCWGSYYAYRHPIPATGNGGKGARVTNGEVPGDGVDYTGSGGGGANGRGKNTKGGHGLILIKILD